MCFKVDLKRDTIDQIVSRYGLQRVQEYLDQRGAQQGSLILNAFDHPLVPCLLGLDTQAELMSWGLVPPWIRTPDQAALIKKKTLNARAETMDKLPSFQEASRTRRCVILVTAYIEYRHEEHGAKVPYFLLPEDTDQGILFLGGLWSPWDGSGTCSIVTTEARGIGAWVHNSKLRQPLVLDPRELEPWLNHQGEDHRALLVPREPPLRAQAMVKDQKGGSPKKPSTPGTQQLELF